MHPKAKHLKEILQERGISQVEIAEAAGVRRATVSLVVNNRGTSRPIMKVIARRLGITLDEALAYLPPRAA